MFPRRLHNGARLFHRTIPTRCSHFIQTDAVLWGTLSPKMRADRAALRDYFVGAFKALPGLKVSFGEQLIRVYGNSAVNTGYYTFSYSKDGEAEDASGSLQSRVCERRAKLDNCGSSLVRNPKKLASLG